MPRPEEIAEIINPKRFQSSPGSRRLGRVFAIIGFIVLTIAIVGGGVYFLKKYQPATVVTTNAKPKSPYASAPVAYSTSIENMGSYYRYRPTSFANTAVKRLVFVIPPGGTEQEVRDFISQWETVAEQHGFLIASIVNWDRASIITFLQKVRRTEGVSKVYISGFSNGGYNSCGAGLEFPALVDGIVPMGAFCSATDAVTQGSSAKPILAVIGSKDTWALGEDGQLPYQMDNGLTVEYLIVPNIGHTFPTSAMGQVASWIEKH